ncbi:hypothetical protein HYH02_004872 [Chlamydomonas schloesseri]|uniref:Uncharacterized protein n=1 Tax=Chlamydomonas schloesseri TaxID=2026947 RepID=A0A836B7Y8_9CHLO|nr:hypothetical protein HYH02_004872 [Chlamydomonas schloesseri]|eukprot:KAG2450367.1 hypothetical protein HYH02_004872 [Chlamydomonas schloesseri]
MSGIALAAGQPEIALFAKGVSKAADWVSGAAPTVTDALGKASAIGARMQGGGSALMGDGCGLDHKALLSLRYSCSLLVTGYILSAFAVVAPDGPLRMALAVLRMDTFQALAWQAAAALAAVQQQQQEKEDGCPAAASSATADGLRDAVKEAYACYVAGISLYHATVNPLPAACSFELRPEGTTLELYKLNLAITDAECGTPACSRFAAHKLRVLSGPSLCLAALTLGLADPCAVDGGSSYGTSA